MNIITILILWTIGIALAQGGSSCEEKYLRAADALDKARAQCGLNEKTDKFFCRVAGKINVPVEISGFKFNLNLAAIYRFMNDLHLLPNNLRRTAKLIQEAKATNGRRLMRFTKRLSRNLPEIKTEDVAKTIKKMNFDQRLCPGDQLFTYKQIRFLIEDELARQ